MSIYTCIMQIEQRTKIWSLLLVTINKILCQFFEFTQNLKRSLEIPPTVVYRERAPIYSNGPMQGQMVNEQKSDF